ncbi:MAG: para-aminobenzoate synthetase component 1 [Flavobacteriales bacterium]|jgi:para-aminobenzoate synthetase component 1
MSNSVFLKNIPYQHDPLAYFEVLQELDGIAWLDSGRPRSNQGRYDIFSALPCDILIDPKTHEIQIELNKLFNNIEICAEADKLPFIGGALGYFNYEALHPTFNIECKKSNIRPSITAIFNWSLIQDHHEETTTLVFLPSCIQTLRNTILNQLDGLTRSNDPINPLVVHAGPFHASAFYASPMQANTSKANYDQAHECIQDYILDGDCYQVNYAQRFKGEFSGSGTKAYSHLREALPSPYSAYLDLHNDIVLSFSPEQFIRVNEGKAQTKPIKGTAARGKNPIEDKQLAEGLLNSEKNRAENLMIVDLMRNDFNRYCEPHSVKVPKLYDLESYTNVHHLVSTVRGELKQETSSLEFFLGCFPGGSITGAPKKRAMEIIDELETEARNIYCGSIYYVSANDRMDSNIAIRSLLLSEESIYCWGGGGIVSDSRVDDEYIESINKIGVLLEALKQQ